MRSLQILDGDLVIGPGGFVMVDGVDKVKQDLSVAVREPLGCDRFHPGWGSVLAEYVGGLPDEMTQSAIQAEIVRLVRNYAAVQADQQQVSTLSGLPNRYTAQELVVDVDRIDVRQDFDRLHLRVSVRTATGTTVTLTNSLSI